MWSVGVVLYMMLCGEMPFPGVDDDEIMAAVRVGKYQMNQPVWANLSKVRVSQLSLILAPERVGAFLR